MFIATPATPLVRRSVYAPALRSLDRFLNDALTVTRSAGTQLKDEDRHWTLSVDLPGVSREQLSIAIDGQTVKIDTVAGAPRQYSKAYAFDQEVDAAASSAKLEHGVLTLTLGKRVPESQATTLAIQ